MTDRPLLIDYAFSHPFPAAIKKSGYSGVIRYLSNDPSKDLTEHEAKSLLAAGLSIRLVWESTAMRASQGRVAGWNDRRKAEKLAAKLGYPRNCPIFYAVDFDAEPKQIIPYFKGVGRGKLYPAGGYGSKAVVEALHRAGLTRYDWQTEAWSGSEVSELTDLYQRVKPTRPHIEHAIPGSYDEDIVLRYVPAWHPTTKVTPSNPVPKTPPAPPKQYVSAWSWWRLFILWLLRFKGGK